MENGRSRMPVTPSHTRMGAKPGVPGRISTASGTILTETGSWRPDGRRWETSVTISTRTVPSRSWQYDGPGGGNWYYYDSAGNAKIQWFQDKGNWYWFDSDGKMNKEAVRTIKGKTYAFRLDGSMRVNEYAGFSYTDYDGQPDPAGDILAVNADGTAKTVSEAEENEIAVYINASRMVGERSSGMTDGGLCTVRRAGI